MTFKVQKLAAAEAEIAALDLVQQSLLKSQYETVETKGLEYVSVKALQSQIYEIRSGNIRSLFEYRKGRIIVIGVVFVKKTQKTPTDKIQLAKHRLRLK